MLDRASMRPPAVTASEAASACSACGTALPASKAVCPACGAAHGSANRCPHCSAVADVEPNAALGFACRVCGGPRVPLDVAAVTPGPATEAALLTAKRAHGQHLWLSASGLALSGAGALGLLLAVVFLLAVVPGPLASVVTLLAAGLPLAAGLYALGRAASARSVRTDALHAAQLGALNDVQAVLGAIDSARAAEILRIEPERAELLLAEASVASFLEPGPDPRLRVEPEQAALRSNGAEVTLLDGADEVGTHREKQAGRTES